MTFGPDAKAQKSGKQPDVVAGSELSPTDLSPASPDAVAQMMGLSDWDIATRYHEFRAHPGFQRNPEMIAAVRRVSAQAVLDRAKAILGSVVRPMETRLSPLSELYGDELQAEIEIEETIENAPLAFAGAEDAGVLTAQDVWMEYKVHKAQSVILSVDTSLSMTGEKLALTAVALAVVLLQFPEDPIGIVAFENEAAVLKEPHERISVDELVERFIDVPAEGYTHLEDGMRAALKMVPAAQGAGGSKRPSTVLLTDGKYTAGRDPAYLAPRFPHLVVLKMGRERASRALCEELAQRGGGTMREIADLEELPAAMYAVVKDLLRGRSVV